MDGTPDLARFGRIVEERRKELGLQQNGLPDGPSHTALGPIEKGVKKPAPATLRKLDKSLQWERGSAAKTLAGGQPTPLVAGVNLKLVPSDDLLAEIRRRLRLVQLAARGDDGQLLFAGAGGPWVDPTSLDPPAVGNDEHGDESGQFGRG